MRLVRSHHFFYSTALAAHSRATTSSTKSIGSTSTATSSLSTESVKIISTSTPITLVTSPSTTTISIDVSTATSILSTTQSSAITTEPLPTSITEIITSLTTSIPLTTVTTPSSSPDTSSTPTSTCNTFIAAPTSGPYANLYAQSNGVGNYLTLNGTSFETATRYVLNMTDGTVNELNQLWQWDMNNLPQFAVYQDVDPVVALDALLINCSLGARNGSSLVGGDGGGYELLCGNVNGVGGFEACPVQLPDALIFGQGLGPTSDCVGFGLIAYPVC